MHQNIIHIATSWVSTCGKWLSITWRPKDLTLQFYKMLLSYLLTTSILLQKICLLNLMYSLLTLNIYVTCVFTRRINFAELFNNVKHLHWKCHINIVYSYVFIYLSGCCVRPDVNMLKWRQLHRAAAVRLMDPHESRPQWRKLGRHFTQLSRHGVVLVQACCLWVVQVSGLNILMYCFCTGRGTAVLNDSAAPEHWLRLTGGRGVSTEGGGDLWRGYHGSSQLLFIFMSSMARWRHGANSTYTSSVMRAGLMGWYWLFFLQWRHDCFTEPWWRGRPGVTAGNTDQGEGGVSLSCRVHADRETPQDAEGFLQCSAGGGLVFRRRSWGFKAWILFQSRHREVEEEEERGGEGKGGGDERRTRMTRRGVDGEEVRDSPRGAEHYGE